MSRHRIDDGARSQFDAGLVSHMCELGREDDLAHIVGHTAEGIPAVVCPHCGPVIAIPRNTKDRDIIYCRACHAQLELHRVRDMFEAKRIDVSDDPHNLEPRANEDAVEGLLGQIR